MDDKIIKETYTFDDLLLIPRYSEVLPSEVDLKTKLTKDITLNIPILSAAMDTVTEDVMAIALARVGGLGIIHKNMSIEKQAYLVSKVKRIESGMINKPFVVKKTDTLEKVKYYSDNFGISGMPVVNDKNELIGIITHRDMRYQTDLSIAVEGVMTSKNLITAQKGISLKEAKEILISNKIEKLPILEKNKLFGMITLKDIENVNVYPNACKDEKGRLRVGAAIGVSEDSLLRVETLVEAGVDVISIDSAHGHSRGVLETIKKIRKAYPKLPIIGGNVVTKEAALALIEAGADCIKVGVGPGSICTTRVVAGVGVPQISAVYDVYQACKDKDICVIADGGIKLSGDIAKAIAAGADCVMLGGLLAGCDEAPGEEVIFNGRKFKVYVGMGSIAAMQRGSSDRYFQSNQKEMKKLVPEGIEGRVPYKGSIKDVIFQLIGGLRSGMGYCGTKDIETLKTEARFVKITGAGLQESHPHDVDLLKEAPNYSK
ncbi:MAG: IMP dehydrogenase [Erysipelotrichales bacterium]|nr:IMP dehydrogenase [Erysipelotrichales bacterium]